MINQILFIGVECQISGLNFLQMFFQGFITFTFHKTDEDVCHGWYFFLKAVHICNVNHFANQLVAFNFFIGFNGGGK